MWLQHEIASVYRNLLFEVTVSPFIKNTNRRITRTKNKYWNFPCLSCCSPTSCNPPPPPPPPPNPPPPPPPSPPPPPPPPPPSPLLSFQFYTTNNLHALRKIKDCTTHTFPQTIHNTRFKWYKIWSAFDEIFVVYRFRLNKSKLFSIPG
jgi:hypothetical protein